MLVLVFGTQSKIQSVSQRALLCREEKRALKVRKVKDRSKSNETIRIGGAEIEIRGHRPRGNSSGVKSKRQKIRSV